MARLLHRGREVRRRAAKSRRCRSQRPSMGGPIQTSRTASVRPLTPITSAWCWQGQRYHQDREIRRARPDRVVRPTRTSAGGTADGGGGGRRIRDQRPHRPLPCASPARSSPTPRSDSHRPGRFRGSRTAVSVSIQSGPVGAVTIPGSAAAYLPQGSTHRCPSGPRSAFWRRAAARSPVPGLREVSRSARRRWLAVESGRAAPWPA